MRGVGIVNERLPVPGADSLSQPRTTSDIASFSEREDKMRIRLTHVGLVGLLLILGAREASAEIMRWQVGGETREAIVYVPAGRWSQVATTAT